MEFITSEIEYTHIVADSETNCFQDFKGTTSYPDELSGEEIFKHVVNEHPEHDIIFQSFKLDNIILSHLIYIG